MGKNESKKKHCTDGNIASHSCNQNKEAEKKRKEEEEKEKEERDARNKITTMHFTSVKIHVFEDGHDGRSTKRPRGQGGQKGQDGKAVLSRTDSYSRRKGKSRRPNAIETIPEIQETEADAKVLDGELEKVLLLWSLVLTSYIPLGDSVLVWRLEGRNVFGVGLKHISTHCAYRY